MLRRAWSIGCWSPPALLLLAAGAACAADGPTGSQANGPLQALGLAYDGPGPGRRLTVQYAGLDYPTFAGQLRMRLLTAQERPFNSFCVDLLHPIAAGRKYQTHVRSTDSGLRSGSRIAYLYNRYGQAEGLDPTDAAALQLAIWDQEIDGGDGLNRGTFRYLPDDAIARRTGQLLEESRGRTDKARWLDARANGPDSDLKRGQSVLAPAFLADGPRGESAPRDIIPAEAVTSVEAEVPAALPPAPASDSARGAGDLFGGGALSEGRLPPPDLGSLGLGSTPFGSAQTSGSPFFPRGSSFGAGSVPFGGGLGRSFPLLGSPPPALPGGLLGGSEPRQLASPVFELGLQTERPAVPFEEPFPVPPLGLGPPGEVTGLPTGGPGVPPELGPQNPVGGAAVVPEPSAFLLAAASLVCLMVFCLLTRRGRSVVACHAPAALPPLRVTATRPRSRLRRKRLYDQFSPSL